MKQGLILLLAILIARFTFAQGDSNHYMHSYASVNVGYAVNMRPASNRKYLYPFWGKDAPTVSVSGLFALKQSYFAIPVTVGYFAPSFDVGSYLGFYGDTTSTYPYSSLGTNRYHIYYLLGGLGLKLPQRTSPAALELRLMLGPIMVDQSEIQYSYNPHLPDAITVDIKHGMGVAFGICPGVGLGYVISNRLALMANADLIFGEITYNTFSTAATSGSSYSQTETMRCVVFYGNYTASLVYTFGKMTPNIMY